MKKIISLVLVSVMALTLAALFACSKDSNNFFGKWSGESLSFSVEPNGENKVKIVNENGTLLGEIKDGKIVGKNELGMSFEMTVKGDSAYYTFAEITTGYKRVK